MKRSLIFILSIFFTIVLSSHVNAKVTGLCSNCHTMHNSQGGAPVAVEYRGSATTIDPQSSLVKYNCHGCHISTATNTICSDGTPIVYNINASYANPLAGGNFYEMKAEIDDTKGHNVEGVTLRTDIAPPGFTPSARPTGFTQGGTGWGPSPSWSAGTQVTCAGEYGCHGDRSSGYDGWQAVKGGHHGDDTTIDGTTVAKSYRFLAGIEGVELNTTDYKWEQQANSTHHNGYQGASTYDDDNTISYLCGECHGNYHGHADLGDTDEVGGSTPWLRHPADFAFSGVRDGNYTGSEYAEYNTPNTDVYSTLAPVAETSPSTTTPTVTSASIVMCLSCHRAHGSPYYKLMRWEYDSTSLATSLEGCWVCHTSKN